MGRSAAGGGGGLAGGRTTPSPPANLGQAGRPERARALLREALLLARAAGLSAVYLVLEHGAAILVGLDNGETALALLRADAAIAAW